MAVGENLRAETVAKAMRLEIQWLRDALAQASGWESSSSHRTLTRPEEIDAIRGSGLFDEQYYRLENPDLLPEVDPVVDFLERGSYEGRRPNRLFDPIYYLKMNPDVSLKRVSPLTHFIEFGWSEGRRPCAFFDPAFYLARYPDVAEMGINPLLHYLREGEAEGRLPAELVLPDPSTMPDRQRLRDYLVDEEFGIGEAAANRVLDYFRIVEGVRLSGESPEQPRRTVLRSLLNRVRPVATALATDNRTIDASIIVPVHNHIEYTIACVMSVLEHKCDARFEIIVADDASTDETREFFAEVGGVVRCVTTPTNKGFLRNCNYSAAYAGGAYIALLNNDTFVLDGWLDELLAPFARIKDVGLVGSKLLMTDGTLQEAGGIIWRDASGWNFGRGQDPRGCQFNYVKDVDYTSAASAALPQSLWRELNGFDEWFVPAYAEDTDLSFRVRERGLRTLYSPL